MKKFLQKFVYMLLLLFGLSNYTSSQEYFNYDDYVYEEDDFDDDYDSFFDNDEYDIDYYESANIGELVYNPVTGRMQRSYYYVGRTLYVLDLETGRYYPIRNRFRRSISYPDQFYFDNFWYDRSNFVVNFNFNGGFFNQRYPFWGNWRRGNSYRNFNNFNWGIAFGGINRFTFYYNGRYGNSYPYGRFYNPYRSNRGWWGWYGPGRWNSRQNNRSNLVNVGNFSPNRNIRLATPNRGQGRTRSTSNRNNAPRDRGIVNNRSNNPRESTGRSGRNRPNSGTRANQRNTRSSDIVNSRRSNRVNSPSRGETSRINQFNQAISRSNYAQVTRNEAVSRSQNSNSRSERRSYDKSERRNYDRSESNNDRPQRNNRSNYDRSDRSSSQSRKIKESRSRNQVKSERSSRSQKKFKSQSNTPSRNSSRNRSNDSQKKYSSGRNNKSSSYKQKSGSNKSKKANKRY